MALLPDLVARLRFALDASGLVQAQARVLAFARAVKAVSGDMAATDARTNSALTNIARGSATAAGEVAQVRDAQGRFVATQLAAAADIERVRDAQGRFTGRQAAAATDLTQAEARVNRFGRSIRGLANDLTMADAKTQKALSNISKGALVAGAGLTAGFALAGRATLGFDKTISEVAAASEATGATLDRLRDAAIEAGAATAFSAVEAAQAQAELAKAGISTADILGGALRGSLDLAAAGSLELGRSAEIAAAAMTVFKLSGNDVGHVADVLAAGANKSSADVEGLAQALDQSGLVAAQFGLGLEDTVGVLAQFAQAGLKGSDAGTSLKTALQRFVPQSKEARDAMEALGISLFDSEGRFIGIQAAAQELQDGLGSLSEKQRLAALTTMFGADAIRAATILYEGGGRAVAEWRDKVDDAGAASETAATKLDNLAGDLEELGGSIETALIGSGTAATGVLRFLAKQATSTVNAFAELPAPVQATATGFAAIAGPTLLAAGAVGTLIPKIATARSSLEALGTGGAAASRGLGLLGRASAIGAGIGLLAGTLELLNDQLLRLQHGSGPKLSEFSNELVRFGETGRAAGELAGELGGDLGALADKLQDVSGGVPSGGILGNLSGFFQTSGRVKDAKRDLDALDQSLAQLVQGGHTVEASRIFERLVASLAGTGFGRVDLERQLGAYTGALADVDTQSRLTAGSTDSLTDRVKGLGGAFDETSEAAGDMLDATIAQIEAELDNTRAMGSFADAVADVADKERALADARRDRSSASRDAISVERSLNSVEDARSSVLDRERELADARAGRGRKAREIIEAERALADAQRSYNEAAAKGSDGLRDRARASEGLTDAQERLRRAREDGGREADVADATEALSRAQLDAREAELSLSEARQRSAERARDAGATVKKAEEELVASRENAKAAAIASGRAAQDLAEQQALAAGRTLTVAGRYTVFRDRLIELKDTLVPGSPLRRELEATINQLGELPPGQDMTITADASQAKGELATVGSLIDSIKASTENILFPIDATPAKAELTAVKDLVGAIKADLANVLPPPGPSESAAPELDRRQKRRLFGATFHTGGSVVRPRDLPTVPELAPREVPAVLELGEFVINARSAARIGVDRLERLNRFHDGGLVDVPRLRIPELRIPELQAPAMARAGAGATPAAGAGRPGTVAHFNLPPADVYQLAHEVVRLLDWEDR
jgi:TP901 family phage tail tape measure protein